MEALLAITLFGSIFWAGFALTAFFIICFWADYKENGYVATVFFIALGALFYFFGKEAWLLFISIFTWLNLLIYFGVGLIHAFIRIFFYGRNEMIKLNEDRLSKMSVTHQHKINRDIKSNVFRWWFLWPISLLNWFIKDIIHDIYNWCYDKLNRIFNVILDFGIKSVPEIPEEPKEKEKKI